MGWFEILACEMTLGTGTIPGPEGPGCDVLLMCVSLCCRGGALHHLSHPEFQNTGIELEKIFKYLGLFPSRAAALASHPSRD